MLLRLTWVVGVQLMADPDDRNSRDGGFLGRWSQRKVKARQDALPVVESDKPSEHGEQASSAPTVLQAPFSQPLDASQATPPSEVPNKPPSPTLEDVAKLTKDSDYSAFATRHVDSKVRNAAMRKLFSSDPHFNVMDGLDIYIDDYSVGEPIAKSMLRQMVQARSLGLLDDDLVEQDKPSSIDLPPDLAANDNAGTHENTDLQLQPDDATGHSGIARRVEPAEKPNAFPNVELDADGFKPRPS